MSKKDHNRFNGSMDSAKVGAKMKGQISGKKSERIPPRLEMHLEHAKEYIPHESERKIEGAVKSALPSPLQRMADSKIAKWGGFMLARKYAPRVFRSRTFYGMGLVGLAAFLYRRRISKV